MRVPTNPQLGSEQHGQTTATQMAVAVKFQRSDAWRDIKIHDRLGQHSQKVKTNKSNIPTSDKTNRRKDVSETCPPLEPFVSLCVSVLL